MKKSNDLTGLIGIYYQTWGSEHKSKQIKSWVKASRTQEAIKRVQQIAAHILSKGQIV